jgi:hypothetical protein
VNDRFSHDSSRRCLLRYIISSNAGVNNSPLAPNPLASASAPEDQVQAHSDRCAAVATPSISPGEPVCGWSLMTTPSFLSLPCFPDADYARAHDSHQHCSSTHSDSRIANEHPLDHTKQTLPEAIPGNVAGLAPFGGGLRGRDCHNSLLAS